MRYGNPTIQNAWEKLRDCAQIMIFPLFPHYASSSTGSALEEVYKLAKREWNLPSLVSVKPFFQEAAFISPLAQHIQSELSSVRWEHLVFSFHGLPQHHIEKSGCKGSCALHSCSELDSSKFCYRAQCFATVRHLSQAMGLNKAEYSIAFQSRLGRRPWIKPYFDHLLLDLRRKGLQRIAVVCPSFVADCLETLEEIRIRANETWKKLGGEQLMLISCLNDSPAWVRSVSQMLRQTVQD
jgi:ferrochelatase